MGRLDYGPGKKGYLKRQNVMLHVFFQICQFVYNMLFLYEIQISMDQTKYDNNLKRLGLLAT